MARQASIYSQSHCPEDLRKGPSRPLAHDIKVSNVASSRASVPEHACSGHTANTVTERQKQFETPTAGLARPGQMLSIPARHASCDLRILFDPMYGDV